jgi:hypothetical protein
MRFLSVDPLAADYAAWSSYNYVLGNPIRVVDSDGKAPDDIIITFRINTVDRPEVRVNYKADGTLIDMRTGKEYSGNNSYVKQIACDLDEVRETSPRMAELVTYLTNNTPIHEISNLETKKSGRDGKGTYNRPNGNGSFTPTAFNVDRTQPWYLSDADVLVHELKHAFNRQRGIAKKSVGNSVYSAEYKKDVFVSREELDATAFQNLWRTEKGISLLRTTFAGANISQLLQEHLDAYYNDDDSLDY